MQRGSDLETRPFAGASDPAPRGGRRRGFTYVEALAALTILAVAGGIVLAAIGQQRRAATLAAGWETAARWLNEAETRQAGGDPLPDPPDGWTLHHLTTDAPDILLPVRSWDTWQLASPADLGVEVSYTQGRRSAAATP